MQNLPLAGHYEGEADRTYTYRTKQEIEEWMGRCPIKRFQTVLLDQGIMSQEGLKNIEQEVHIPGLKVVLPSTPHDAKGLLKTAIREDNPVIFFGRQQLVAITGPVPEEEYLSPFGKAEIRREGKDITVVSYSFMVHKLLRAANEVAKQGIETEVIDLRTLRPLDIEAILRSVEKTGRLLIVHQACTTGGFGAEIAGIVAEKGFDLLTAPIYRLGALDVPVPYNPPAGGFCHPP